MAASGPTAVNAYRKLLTQLSLGAFKPGSRLPSERELASSLGISRTTLRQSLQALAEEGLIVASDRRGWFVPNDVVGEPPNTLQSFSEMARAKGLAAESHVLKKLRRPVQFDEANSLRIPVGSDVLELVRVRSLDGTPICYDSTVIALRVAPQLEHIDLENRSLYEVLSTECNIEISQSLYSVHAALMGPELASLLRATAESPALIADELTFDRSSTPILRATLTYRADSYRFQANLLRPATR
jgi:GntR family transcriptional regulator